MGSHGRLSSEERKLEGGMSEKQSGLPPPVSASEAKSSGLPSAVYIAYGSTIHAWLRDGRRLTNL